MNGTLSLKLIFAFVFFFTAFDMIEDYQDGATLYHLSTEFVVIISCLAGFFMLMQGYCKKVKSLALDLSEKKEELKKWKDNSQRYLKGLSEEIDLQFGKWGFTPVEKEIGFLLLKGFSFKEIADIRSKKERTVRQQALEIYKKSELHGRAEFSAFFLEDLLPPTKSADDLSQKMFLESSP